MAPAPDTYETAAPSEEHRFPCPTCGADLRYAPEGAALLCDHCGFREEVETGENAAGGALRELDYHAAVNAALPDQEIIEHRISQCPNCGAQVEFDEASHATECPFCATPVVTDTGLHRHIKPRALLPFGLSEEQARAAMGKWLGRLWFAPNGLKQYARKGRRMRGIYVPYWTYDADTKSRYTGVRGDYYYETKTVIKDGKPQQVQVRKTRWRPAQGRVARWFDDVLVLASNSLPKRYTDALEPWDLSELQPYRPDFIAGFAAEGYQIAVDDGFEQARAKMDRVIERDVRFDIGGDVQKITTLDTKVSDITFKHILLPVWVAAYNYRGKTYRFVVNGRSGRVQGERPYSAWKIAFAVVLVAIAAAIAGYIYAMNQQ